MPDMGQIPESDSTAKSPDYLDYNAIPTHIHVQLFYALGATGASLPFSKYFAI